MNNLLFFWLSITVSVFSKPVEPAFPEMILVRGGYFHQGDSLGNADEKPVRQIRLSDFYMAKTELTLAQFQEFIQTTGYQTDAERGEGSYIWSALGWVKKTGVCWQHDEKGNLRPETAKDYPVIHVSWLDAAQYCNWLSTKQQFQAVYTFQGDSIGIDREADGFRIVRSAQ